MKRFLCATAVLTCTLSASLAAGIQAPKEVDEQRAWEEKYDKLNIRHSAKVLTDTSPDFLKAPEYYSDIRDFEVAKTPPTIDFVITQGLQPEYLPYGLARKTGGAWAGGAMCQKLLTAASTIPSPTICPMARNRMS